MTRVRTFIIIIAGLTLSGKNPGRNNRIRPLKDILAIKETAKPATLQPPQEVAQPSIPASTDQELWKSAGKNVGNSDAKKEKAKIDEIIEPPSDYHYASFGFPDPFLPPLVAEPEAKSNGKDTPIISPLQKYPLASLFVSGIWHADTGEWKCLVMTKNGEGIIAKVGDPIANKEGKITHIHAAGIKVREYEINPDGTREIIESEMTLTPYDSATANQITRLSEQIDAGQKKDFLEDFKSDGTTADMETESKPEAKAENVKSEPGKESQMKNPEEKNVSKTP